MYSKRLTTIAMLAIGLLAGFGAVVVNAQESSAPIAEFEGTVVAAREAEITPIVNGWLNKINFKPGEYVQQGTTLFEFSQTPQKLRIKQAEAQLARARATLKDAEAKLKRATVLKKRDVTSEAQLLEAEAARDIAAADVELAESALGLQNMGLMQLTQKAPFSGIMSAPLVKENGWHDVTKNEIRMATITQLDPIHVIGEVPYSVYSERRKILKTDDAVKAGLVLSIVLPDGETYPHEGKLVSGGYKVEEKTQKITVWAEFSNPDLLLRPGLKVKVRSRLVN